MKDGTFNFSSSTECKTEGCGKFWRLKLKSRKLRTAARSTPRTGCSTSRSESALGCCKWPTFRMAGARMVKFCAEHESNGMVNVSSSKCRTEVCGKKPSFGMAGTKTAECCIYHAPDGMVDVKNRKC